MLVGEGPGRQEDEKGVPFIGPSGQLLTDILERHGLLRDSIYITYVLKRRVQNDDDPTDEEIAHFRQDLVAELHRVRPDYVIAAGGFAARFFLGEDFNLELGHGLPQWSYEWDVPVIPCYHPASAMHDTENMQSVYWDYQRAVLFARGELGLHEVEPASLRIVEWQEMPLRVDYFAIDTEDLVDGQPWCATVSWADGIGAFITPDNHAALSTMRGWLEQGAVCFIHNSLHDLQPLRKLGQDWRKYLHWAREGRAGGGRIVDTQVLAYEQGRIHTQALKTLSYRLLGQLMTSYEEIVGPKRQEMAWYDLVTLASQDWGQPEETAAWDEKAGKVKITKPWSLNRRIDNILSSHSPTYKAWCEWKKALAKEVAKVRKRKPMDGPPYAVVGEWAGDDPLAYTPNPKVDLIDRWGNLDAEALAPIIAAGVDPRIGRADLSHCDRTVATTYAVSDAVQTRRLGLHLLQRHQAIDLDGIAQIDHGQIPMVERMMRNGLPSNRQYFQDLGQEMRRMQAEIAEVLTLAVGRPVNPNSSDQVAQLLYEEMRLPVVKLTPAGKASTGKKALEHLRKDNPLVDLMMQSREYAKVDDAFCGNIASRTLTQEDGWERAFYQLMVTRVKTGRLAAKNFNSLAIPTRTELGRRIRYGFKARPGRLLGTWDLNQIEMRVMAHMSNDPLMVEVYNRSPKKYAKHERDLHIITAAKVYNCKPEDVKKTWRTACKSTGFGIIMGITGKGLQDQMRLYGLDPSEWTEDRCNELIREWLKVYQGVNDFQLNCRAYARRHGEVRDMFGRRFPLPHARCPLSWIAGEAERQSHALPIQSTAQCIEKLAMARLDQEVYPAIQDMGYCEPILQVHDELIWEFDEDLAETLDALMMDVLTSVVQLRVPVEAGGVWGPSWGDLEK